MIRLQPLIAGAVRGPVLKLGAPLSFWGGVDHLSSKIIDVSHPQTGSAIAARILILPMIRGSGGTPGAIASLMKDGLSPTALLLGYPEINVLTGVLIGQKLYGVECPTFLADATTLENFRTGQMLSISNTGECEQVARL